MKRLVLAWLAVCFFGPLHALATELGSESESSQQQRRIDMLRYDAAQQAHEEERVCQQRFAVNDCLKAARARNLEKTAEIRKQQERLNDLQRVRRGEEKIRAHEERTAQHELDVREAATRLGARVEPKLAAKNDDQQRSTSDAEVHSRSHGSAEGATTRSQQVAPSSRQDYQRKVQEAEKRRQERDKRIAEKVGGKRPAPLPAVP